MKKLVVLIAVTAMLFTNAASAQSSDKLVSKKSQITFFSTTPAEDIEAVNTSAVGTLNKESGEVVFSVPMQGFEFEKSLMQKHFNQEKFLDTKQFPKAKFKGTIVNLEDVNFSEDGEYETLVEGEMTIKGVTNPVKEKGSLVVKGSTVKGEGKFDITLADYGIEFVKGKPASNVAKTVEVTVKAEY